MYVYPCIIYEIDKRYQVDVNLMYVCPCIIYEIDYRYQFASSWYLS